MATSFDDVTLDEAKRSIIVLKVVKDNREFVKGNHYNKQKFWIGPIAKDGDVRKAALDAETERGFVSKNTVKDGINRHDGGVLGREPHYWPVAREDPETGVIMEVPDTDITIVRSMLTGWWEHHDMHALLREIDRTALWASTSIGRLFFPRGRRDALTGTVNVDTGDIITALTYIFPDHPNPEEATVFTDLDSMDDAGIFVTKEKAKEEGGTGTGKEFGEITWVDRSIAKNSKGRAENTVFRELGGNENTYAFDLGGRIPIFQIKRPLLITEQVQQLQKALNVAMTNLPRLLGDAGWQERALLNAQMPGHWTFKPDGSRDKFIPNPLGLNVGPSSTAFYSGLDYEETDPTTGRKKTVVTSPDIKWKPPVEVRSTVESIEALNKAILEELGQSHILKNESANATGRSMEVARTDYIATLMDSKPQIDQIGSWFLETALAMAEWLAGVPGKYTDRIKIEFQCHLDAGPIGNDEKRVWIEQGEKGYASPETAMHAMGIEDVPDELKRMGRYSTLRERMSGLSSITSAGFDLLQAQQILNEEITRNGGDVYAVITPPAPDPVEKVPGNE